jgi:hypothetical protein
VPASLDDTAPRVPTRDDEALPPAERVQGARGAIGSVAYELEPALRGAFPIGLVADHVDMIVPPHYSAAPSGDLCTTLRQSFVVRGESKSSVPTTGDRPLRSRSSTGLSAVGQRCLRLLCSDAEQRSYVQPCAGQASAGQASAGQAHAVERSAAERSDVCRAGAKTLSLPYVARGAAGHARRAAVADASTIEKLKHDLCDAQSSRIFRAIYARGGRRSEAESAPAQPVTVPRGSAPRNGASGNRIFT